MSIKQRVQNWKTNRAIARDERKAEKEEEKLYIRAKVREAKEKRRQTQLEAKAERIANRPSVTERITTGLASFGGGSSGKGRKKKSGLDNLLGSFEVGSNLDVGLGNGSGLDFGFGGTKRKGKKRKNDKFGGFL